MDKSLMLLKRSLPQASLSQTIAARRERRTTCLLLDTSGSMAEDCGDGTAKIDALRALLSQLPRVRTFSFASGCWERPPRRAAGGTNLAGALIAVRAAGCTSVVLVTDGLPDSEDLSLHAAQGLWIDVVYVGPDPMPKFLRQLTEQCGGHAGRGTLSRPRELTSQIAALLEDLR